MTDGERIFGPDRDGPPGITPVPGTLPPQITEVMVESAAMHSRSLGWLPAIVIRMATEDGAGITGSLRAGPQALKIARDIIAAHDRAKLDVRQGVRDGTLP